MARKKKTTDLDFDPWLVVQYALIFAVTVDEQKRRGNSPQLADNIDALRKSKIAMEEALINRYEEFERDVFIYVYEQLCDLYEKISKKGLDSTSAKNQIQVILASAYTFFDKELQPLTPSRLNKLNLTKEKIRELKGAKTAAWYGLAQFFNLKSGEGIKKAKKENRIKDLADSESFPRFLPGVQVSSELKVRLAELARDNWQF